MSGGGSSNWVLVAVILAQSMLLIPMTLSLSSTKNQLTLVRLSLEHMRGACAPNTEVAATHNTVTVANPQTNKPAAAVTFLSVARSSNPVTDKIGPHRYDQLYDLYFNSEVQQSNVKLLEIGLGCNMGYGPGASAQIWTTLLPKAEIWFAEYDKGCVERHHKPEYRWKYVTGDQADLNVLTTWAQSTGGNFDYIIDDGGHTVPQMWNSFQYLWEHALKPGGVYFIEDMQLNRAEGYYNGGIPGGQGETMVDAIIDWVDQLIITSGIRGEKQLVTKTFKHILPGISRIDCISEMCAFTKAK